MKAYVFQLGWESVRLIPAVACQLADNRNCCKSKQSRQKLQHISALSPSPPRHIGPALLEYANLHLLLLLMYTILSTMRLHKPEGVLTSLSSKWQVWDAFRRRTAVTRGIVLLGVTHACTDLEHKRFGTLAFICSTAFIAVDSHATLLDKLCQVPTVRNFGHVHGGIRGFLQEHSVDIACFQVIFRLLTLRLILMATQGKTLPECADVMGSTRSNEYHST